MFSWILASTRAPKTRAVLVSAVALALALPAVEAAAQNIFNSDCLPPQTTYAGQFHAKYSDGTNVYDLTQPRHADFTGCNPPPPPPPPGTTTHSFTSHVNALISINGGPPQPVQGPANTTVRVDYNHQTGQTRFFDTEMLQLDLNAGPALIRESPTKQSLGKTAITDLGGGQFRIDSFFDIFTELSVDGGQTWHPSTDSNGNPFAGRMEIPGTVPVTSLGWGNVKSLYRNP
jgi:hypothetical protein